MLLALVIQQRGSICSSPLQIEANFCRDWNWYTVSRVIHKCAYETLLVLIEILVPVEVQLRVGPNDAVGQIQF